MIWESFEGKTRGGGLPFFLLKKKNWKGCGVVRGRFDEREKIIGHFSAT